MQGRLILFDRAVDILAKGVAFGTQLVSTPGVRERSLQLRVRLSPQRLVSALQPVAGLGIFLGRALQFVLTRQPQLLYCCNVKFVFPSSSRSESVRSFLVFSESSQRE